jgi:ABC-2 type transport system permease protein
MTRNRFSFSHTIAVMMKELIQMRRDRLTFGMIIGIPIIQLLLFGYAINTDPKDLPAVVNIQDHSIYARSVLKAVENTGYFNFIREVATEEEARLLLERGEVSFVFTIPADFSAKLVRGERPQLLIEADATDPSAASNALSAISVLEFSALRHDLRGSLSSLAPGEPPIELRVHRLYNPEGLSSYNVVPGLIGVILTMTMVLITALAVTRETERGTMENLLAMPLKPMVGSLILLSFVLVLFIAANLAVGFTFSAIARNQLQSMQMTFFFFLPSILLSGFMFPFRGMPIWAQWIGEALSLTNFLRMVR